MGMYEKNKIVVRLAFTTHASCGYSHIPFVQRRKQYRSFRVDTKARISRNRFSAVTAVGFNEFCTIPPAGHSVVYIGDFISQIYLVV